MTNSSLGAIKYFWVYHTYILLLSPTACLKNLLFFFFFNYSATFLFCYVYSSTRLEKREVMGTLVQLRCSLQPWKYLSLLKSVGIEL